MQNCLICHEPFEPTNRKHVFCSNLCNVNLYNARKKAKLLVKEIVMSLNTPSEVFEFQDKVKSLLTEDALQ